jgi:hypothetical protein
MPADHPFGILNFGLCDFPFDSAQDREPVERLVEPFDICVLLFEFFLVAET